MGKKLSLGRSISEKHQELQNNENAIATGEHKVLSEVTKLVTNRNEAMKDWDLKPITTGNKFELEREHYDVFAFLAKKLKKDISKLASEYVYSSFKTDYKRYKSEFKLPDLEFKDDKK